MSGALIILGGLVYIVLSIIFRFTPRLRVVVGLIVGGLLTGAVARQINKWLADGIDQIAKPIGRFIGWDTDDVALAIPSAIAFGLAIVVVVFLRKGKGGGGLAGGGKGAGKGNGGGGGRSGKLAYVALACALLLPIILGGLGETIRDVVA